MTSISMDSTSLKWKNRVCEPRLTLYTGEHKCTITNRVENVIKFWVGMMTNLMD